MTDRYKQRRTTLLRLISVMVLVAVSTLGASLAADDAQSSPSRTSGTTAMAGALLTPSLLEHEGAKIGSVDIISDNIFDPNDPAERRILHRWANALHITTKPHVISTQLLFEPGDDYDKQTIEETERLLRSNRYLRDAKIVPTSFTDGVVNLEVHTSDVWTFSPSVSFGRGGGKNSGGVGIKEYNLFGRGTSIGIGYKSDVDRDTLSLRYFDGNLFDSRYQVTADYTDASDGYTQSLELERPFFALDTRRAGGGKIHSGRRTESLYNSGDIAAQFEHSYAEHEAYFGWSKGLTDNWSRRYVTGIGYDSHNYSSLPNSLHPSPPLPADRRFVYPFVGIEFVQNDYVTTRNFDQMNRTEDRHLGLRASARLGYASSGVGSTSSAWLYKAEFSNTFYRSAKGTFVVGADLHGRFEAGTSRDAKLSISGRYDWRQSEKRLFHAGLSVSVGRDLDIEDSTYLGGNNGLRGYPLRFQTGDSSVLLTLEQRLFTDWYPFRLFNVGGAIFFDAGRTWGDVAVPTTNSGWLRNIGVGLRIGSTRSGLGRMIHVDLAYPLDGGSDISNVQLLVEARKGF